MHKYITFLLLFFSVQMTFAQGEANNWYFGFNAGVTFNNGTPQALTNGALRTVEGCATISDAAGNLLFYTDGITVYNRNHQAMPNGDGLMGHPSSTQSAIIVPHPGNTLLFYVFTVDHWDGNNGLRYNVVDMSLENGLGDVTSEKNILLYTITTEKITAVQHANGNDIWVITRLKNDNLYRVYKVDSNGLDIAPVESRSGFTYPVSTFNTGNAIGYMKTSPDGSKLVTNFASDDVTDLCDFDVSTGLVSNALRLENLNNDPNVRIYAAEFSPDNRFLYLGMFPSGIYRYDLSFNTVSDITASQEIIMSDRSLPNDFEIGALQLGPDGNIYIAQFFHEYLGVLDNPNDPSSGRTYTVDGVFLDGAECTYGLPPFITSYFASTIEVENTCLGDITTFNLSSNQSVVSVDWDFGDGTTSNLDSPTHVYNAVGTYTVTATIDTGSEIVTRSQEITIHEVPTSGMPQDMIICDDNNDGIATFDLSEQDIEILDNQDDTVFEVVYYASLNDFNNENPIDNTTAYNNTTAYAQQEIWYSIQNRENAACRETGSFFINVFDSPTLPNTVSGLEICDDESAGSDTDGIVVMDLTSQENLILDGQQVTDFNINYYRDAARTNQIMNPSSYQNSLSQETIYFTKFNVQEPSCSIESSFEIEVFALPVVNETYELIQCDDDNDGFTEFNLTDANEFISPDPQNSVRYFNSLILAEDDSNALTGSDLINHPNNVASNDVIVAKVTTPEGCSRVFSMGIVVTTTQIPPSFERTIYQCDNGQDLYDGIATFDLTAVHTEITNLFPAGQSLEITHHTLEEEALNGQNPILDISDFSNNGSPNNQLLYTRVQSTVNGECIAIGQFIDLVVESIPINYGPFSINQCDAGNDGQESIDSSTFTNMILQGQTDVAITYRDAQGNSLPSPLPDPFVTDSQVLEVTLTNTSSNDPDGACSITTTLEFIVDAGVQAFEVGSLEGCDDDGDGRFSFNTSNVEQDLLNGQTGVQVTYIDSNGATLPSPLPNPFISNSQVITATVTNPLNALCFAERNIAFIVHEVPQAFAPEDDIVCDGFNNDGFELFDLTQYDTEVLNGQDASLFQVRYYDSRQGAIQGNGDLSSNYRCETREEIIHVRIENRNNTGCYALTSFKIGVSFQPEAFFPDRYEICDDLSNDEVTLVDLTMFDNQVLGNQDPTNLNVTYHLSQQNAELSQNALETIYETQNNPEIIFVRIENSLNPECHDFSFFEIEVFEQPVLTMEDQYVICDGDPITIQADLGYDFYDWSTSDTGETITIGAPGVYTVEATNDYGSLICSTTKQFEVIQSNVPVIENIVVRDWSADDNSISIQVSGNGDYEYSVDGFSYQNSSEFTGLPFDEYTVFVRDVNGCGTVSQEVNLLYHPKFFTPNNDGYNDYWQLYNSTIEPAAVIHIFDRHGKLLAQIDPMGQGWDGTFNGNPLPSSDYWFKVIREDGTIRTGHFSLKR